MTTCLTVGTTNGDIAGLGVQELLFDNDDILILCAQVILAFALQVFISLILSVMSFILRDALERRKGILHDKKLRYEMIRVQIDKVLAGGSDTQTVTGMARSTPVELLLMLMRFRNCSLS